MDYKAELEQAVKEVAQPYAKRVTEPLEACGLGPATVESYVWLDFPEKAFYRAKNVLLPLYMNTDDGMAAVESALERQAKTLIYAFEKSSQRLSCEEFMAAVGCQNDVYCNAMIQITDSCIDWCREYVADNAGDWA